MKTKKTEAVLKAADAENVANETTSVEGNESETLSEEINALPYTNEKSAIGAEALRENDDQPIVMWAWGEFVNAAYEAIEIYRRDVDPDAQFEVVETNSPNDLRERLAIKFGSR